MQERKKHNVLIIGTGLLIGVVLVYLFSSLATSNRMSNLEINTREELTEQRALLVAIGEATGRNGADEVTELIVRDCAPSERDEFDQLLGSLDNGLTQTELQNLERLFGRCGSFYAERKAVMVSRLVREIEVYEYLVEQLSLVTGSDQSETYDVAAWQTLADNEEKRSELLSELVRLQDEIISTLLVNNNPQSDEITSILRDVREAQETLVVINKQTSDARSEVIDL